MVVCVAASIAQREPASLALCMKIQSLKREWKRGETLKFNLTMPVVRARAASALKLESDQSSYKVLTSAGML